MKTHTLYLLSVVAVGLASCGSFSTPPSTPEEVDYSFTEQGIPPTCTPYTPHGAGWSQNFYLNDGATPYNYQSYTTVLPRAEDISLVAYPINSSGGKATATAQHYVYFNRPPLILIGTPEGGGTPTNVYINSNNMVGLAYMDNIKMFDLRINNSTNDFKTITNGIVSSAITSGNKWTGFPTGRFQPGKILKVEMYLKGNITYKNEVVLANYQGQAGQPKKWFKVAMPYQDLVVRVNTDPYLMDGTPTYTFVTSVRGISNTPDPDHRFWFRNELNYPAPYDTSVGKNLTYGSSTFNAWLDERKDYVLNWSIFDQRVGKVTVDANNNPSAPTEVKTPADWNLGTPSSSNNFNCTSKVTTVYNDQRRFDHIMPAATVNAPKLAGPSVTSGTARTVTSPDSKISETRATTSFVIKNSGTQPLTYSWSGGAGLVLSDAALTKVLAPGTSRTITVSGNCPIDPNTGKPILYNETRNLVLNTNDPRQTAGNNLVFGSTISIKVVCAATTLYGWSNGTQTYVNLDFPAQGQSSGFQLSSNPLADFQSKLTTDLVYSNPREVNPAGGLGSCRSQLYRATNATQCFWADVEANPAFEAGNETAAHCARALQVGAAIWYIDHFSYPAAQLLFGDATKDGVYGTGVCNTTTLNVDTLGFDSEGFMYSVRHSNGNTTYFTTEDAVTFSSPVSLASSPDRDALTCARALVTGAAIWNVDHFDGYPDVQTLIASPEVYSTQSCLKPELVLTGNAVSSGSFTYTAQHAQGTVLYTATDSGITETNLP